VVRSNAIFAATHGATKLMSQPLFPSIAGPEEAFDLQGMVLGVLRSFENSDAFKANHWGVWTAWYENQLNDTSRSLFNAEQEKKIALQPDEFWEGGAKDVNAEIAEIVGWPWEKKERIFVSYSTVDEQDARWMVDAAGSEFCS